MKERDINDFSVRMYENSSILFAIIKIELDESGEPVDGSYVYCNQAFVKVMGNSELEQYKGRKCSEILPESGRKWLPICYEAAFSENALEVTDTLEEKGISLRVHVFSAGHKGYCAILAEDMTQVKRDYQKRIEQANHELRLTLDKEEQFRQATISDSVIVANINVTKNMIEDEIYERANGEMNPVMKEMGIPCPCPLDLFIHTLCEKRVAVQSRENVKRIFDQTYLLDAYERGQLKHVVEYVRFVHNQERRVVRNTVLLTKDPASGDIIGFCNAKDVTAQREREKAYRNQVEQQKRELTEALAVTESTNDAMNAVFEVLGAARWSIKYEELGEVGYTWWSDDLRRMMGYADGEDCPNRLDRHMHPDDLERAEKVLYQIVHDTLGSGGCDEEIRLIDKNGVCRWYRVVGKAARRVDGTPDTFYGVVADIHDRKMVELHVQEEIDQTEQAYRMLHRLIKSGMWSIYYDADGKRSRVEWSNEFRRMVGYTDEKDFPNVLESWSALLHPEDWEIGYGMIDRAVFDKTGTVSYDVEYRLNTRDRGYRWFRATGDIYRRKDGSPYRFYGVFFDIDDQKRHDALEAERKEALERVQTANQAMETIHEAIGSGSWSMEYDEQGRLISVDWSSQFRKMLGFRNELEFPNTFEAWFDRLHPEDKERTRQAFDSTVEDYSGNTTYNVEYRLMTKDRGYRWFQANGQLVRRMDGSPITFYGLFIDIDERKKAEIILEETRKKQAEDLCMVTGLSHEYHALLMIHTKDFQIRMYRDSGIGTLQMAKSLGKEAPYYETFIQRYVERFVEEEDRERVAKATTIEMLQKNIPADGIYTVNFRRINQPGETDYRQMAFSKAISENGEENWAFGFRDINRLVEEEQRQKKLLEDALAAAQHANRAKTVFLNNMSHDIRTPMNAIIGFTSLASSHIDNKEQVQDYLRKIAVSSDHLLSLINDVLDMSRIESGKVKLEENQVHLPDILHDLKTIVQADIHSRQLEFFMDKVDVINEDIICDKLRLNQVLLNLVSNAMKFTRPGGRVGLRVIQKGNTPMGYADYEFHILDTGIGMSREFLERVFEPFEREQTSTTSGIQGTGLGLAITKNIVDMMGGSITVSSEVGKGTEFTVSVRFQIAKLAGKASVHACEVQTEAPDEIDLIGKRILLVEDNALNQEIAVEILQDGGFIVDTADDGTVAVEKMRNALHGQYDLILMDIQMPKMDGYEATRQIRRIEDPKIAHIPIIAMTANAFEEDKRSVLEAGMNAFLAKPIDIGKLFETLTSVLREWAGKDFEND